MYVDQNPDVLRQAAVDGHVIANHSYSHNYKNLYASSEAFIAELEHCNQVITDVIGEAPPRILRFPSGSTAVEMDRKPIIRQEIKAYLEEHGWRYFDWNVSFGDSLQNAPEPGSLAGSLNTSIDQLVAEGQKDIIVLGHDIDGKHWTPDDLPLVIDHCRQNGYVFKVLTADTPVCAFR